MSALILAADDSLRAPENEQDLISLARQYINSNWEPVSDANIREVLRGNVLTELLTIAGNNANQR